MEQAFLDICCIASYCSFLQLCMLLANYGNKFLVYYTTLKYSLYLQTIVLVCFVSPNHFIQ